jgi:hypothetical protein
MGENSILAEKSLSYILQKKNFVFYSCKTSGKRTQSYLHPSLPNFFGAVCPLKAPDESSDILFSMQ